LVPTGRSMSDMQPIVPAGREGKIETTTYREELCKVLRKAPTKRGKVVTVRLHEAVAEYVDALARKKGMKRSTLIRYIIALYIAKTACRSRRHVR
jgi:predicted DNA binding CopG/RHH family protein